jgi:hypothetical protein
VFNAPLVAAGALAPGAGAGIAAVADSYPVLFVILACTGGGGAALAATAPPPAALPGSSAMPEDGARAHSAQADSPG